MTKNEKFVAPQRVSTIKHHNSPNVAVTTDGYTVERTDKVFVQNRFIMVAPYDNHFLYEDPSKKKGRWWMMCTCGSPAVIVGYNAYKQDASPTKSGEMVVCYQHASTGKHAEGSN